MSFRRTLILAAALSTASAALARPDTKALAGTLVNQCAGIKEGDIVMITGGTDNQELLEYIAANVSKNGGHPLLTFGSDRLSRMEYEWTPAKYDTRPPELGLKLANMVQAIITVDYSQDPALFADAPPERIAARTKSDSLIGETMLKRNVRQVSLGNDMYPTPARAKLFGITQDKLTDLFWAGVNTDYAGLQSTGDKVATTLNAAKALTITGANGTNLTVKLGAHKAGVSDGVISAADAKKGGAACQVWLPAGEVYIVPTPGSAEGTVVIDHSTYQGKPIEGLTLTFKAGKLTDMTAKSGLAPLKALYDASGAGKDILGFIDLGINPDVKIPEGSKVLTWVSSGMTTIGVGSNTWAGGDNDANFELVGHLPTVTVKIDGKTIVDNGTLRP